MRRTKIHTRWLALLIAAFLVVLVVPGIIQAKTADTPQIQLQFASFDPLSGKPYLASGQRQSLAGLDSATYLLQFSGPVREVWKATVEKAGVRLYDYVPEYAFIARMDAAAAAKVQEFSFVRWVGLYHPAYRLSPALQEAQFTTSSAALVLLSVQTLPDVDLEGVADLVKVMGGNVHGKSGDPMGGYLRVSLPGGQINALAALEGVLWVEPYIEPVMSNDIGGASIMEAEAIRTTAGLYGSGQIVGVSDSGLDLGTTGAAMSDDFEGRIVNGQAMCATHYSTPADQRTTWSDLNAHGTHVSGSVLGNGALSGSAPGTHTYSSSYAGVAPEAQIVFQALDSDGDGGLECIPVNLSADLFGPAYSLGARIHTNSWGGPTGGPQNPYGGYTLQSRQVDSAAWDFPELLILYAAGNDGTDADSNGFVDPDSIGSPGTAKNVLTIGASENNRPSINSTWGNGWALDFPVDPIANDLVADNASGMAGFSSRGPTDDGRIKPELAAPGTFIISARSHDPSAGTGWGEVTADYLYMGGTSMATPLTAGAAALVREWLTTLQGFTNPSAALIKAVMVNGAADMSPGQYPSPQEIPPERPNNVSGWGRINLVDSIIPPAPLSVNLKDNTAGLSTGGSYTYTLNVGSTSAAAGFEEVVAVASVPEQLSPQETVEPQSEGTPEPPALVLVVERQPVLLELGRDPVDSDTRGPVVNPQAVEADVSLVLDDGSWERANGVFTQDGYSAQFIWLNRFTPAASEYPFTLDQIQVMFDDDGGWNNVSIGDSIDLVVYEDADGDPSNGANFLATYQTTIQAVDGVTWSVYNLAPAVTLNGTGDVLIGVINRYVTDGVSPESWPALKDTTTNSGRSWVGWWSGSPPDPAILPPDAEFYIVNGSYPGNWLIRGYGETSGTTPPTPTPTATGQPPPPPPPPSPSGNPLRVTLAWTDYPGSIMAAKALVNDLDLEVIAPNGARYYGNAGTYASGSACLRDGKWDQCNNLEGVIIPGAAYGTYTIVVHGANVPSGPQPFALAATGDQLAGDVVPPAMINNLAAATGSSSGAVGLTWTAPGNDGSTGKASAYVIKYNTTAITSANWSSSTTLAGVPVPSLAGTPESMTVYGLNPGTTFFFAIKTQDGVPNVSALSNIPSANASSAPDTVPPAAITDLAAHPGSEIGDLLVSWTATGDDERTGTALAYTLRMSTTQITAANWISATLVASAPAPSLAGTREYLELPNMTLGQTYFFAITSQDEVPNVSALSNVDSSTAEDKKKTYLPLALR